MEWLFPKTGIGFYIKINKNAYGQKREK